MTDIKRLGFLRTYYRICKYQKNAISAWTVKLPLPLMFLTGSTSRLFFLRRWSTSSSTNPVAAAIFSE